MEITLQATQITRKQADSLNHFSSNQKQLVSALINYSYPEWVQTELPILALGLKPILDDLTPDAARSVFFRDDAWDLLQRLCINQFWFWKVVEIICSSYQITSGPCDAADLKHQIDWLRGHYSCSPINLETAMKDLVDVACRTRSGYFYFDNGALKINPILVMDLEQNS